MADRGLSAARRLPDDNDLTATARRLPDKNDLMATAVSDRGYKPR